MKKKRLLIPVVFFIALLSSCESEQTKQERLMREEQQRIEHENQIAEEEKARAIQMEQQRIGQEKRAETERIERETQLEKERKEKEVYDKYIDNSLHTGATPYSQYYGKNEVCNDYGCSKIKVTTPSNSDVLVTVKRNDRVIRHAYIRASDSYIFSFPDGIYQAFFYYGEGWNPEKEMKGGQIKGGFVGDEEFGKDEPQQLENSILEYELILQQNGNFSTRPSNPEEAL